MKKIFFFMSLIFLVLLFSGLVNAQISASVSPVKDIILPGQGEKAIFEVNVTNNGISSDMISYIPSDLGWEWNTKSFEIPPKNSKTIMVELTPPKNIKPGIYTVNLKVYSVIDPKIKDINPVVINVVDLNKVITTNFVYSAEGLIPGKQNNLKLEIQNNVKLSLINIHIKLNSKIFSLDGYVDLEPNGKKAIEFFPNVQTGIIKGSYDVNLIATYDGKIIANEIKNIDVSSVKDVQELKKETSSILVKHLSITRINNGNDDSEEMYLHKLSLVQKLFTTTDPGPSFIDKTSGIYTYKWYFQIKPTESYTINVTTNYTNLVVIIIALIVIILLIIYLRGSLTVSKRVLRVKKGNSIVETKVLISLKNRSRKRIKDIRVVDRLPRSMQAPHSYGSVMPVSSKRDEKGYLLVWNIKTMGPAEERVISYRAKANKPIQGMIIFPNVLVRYKSKNDRISTANSGSVSISSKL